MNRIHRIIAANVIAATCAGSLANECPVSGHVRVPKGDPVPAVRPPHRALPSKQGAFVATSKPSTPPGALTPAQAFNRTAFEAMSTGDVAAFKSILETDRKLGQEFLDQPANLSFALGRLDMAIVEYVLRRSPNVLKQASPDTRRHMLIQVISQRSSQERRQRAGVLPDPEVLAREREKAVRLILDAGPFANADSNELMLHLASTSHGTDTVAIAELLLARGQSIDRRSGAGKWERSPFGYAAERRNVPLLEAMLRARKPSQAALDEALVYSPMEAGSPVIERLLVLGANVNVDGAQFDRPQFAPLRMATALAAEDDAALDLVRLLIRYRADPNRGEPGTRSPLMHMVHRPDILKALLELGGDPNARPGGDSALHAALRVPEPYSAEHIARGLDSVIRGEAVSLLLRHGADPNATASDGTTPLMLVRRDDDPAIAALLAKGANVPITSNTKSEMMLTGKPAGPITWALFRGNDVLAEGLVKRDGQTTEDCGAAFYAAATGATRTLGALLDRKARLDLMTYEGRTPFIAAAENGRVGTVTLLLDRRTVKVDEAISKFSEKHLHNASNSAAAWMTFGLSGLGSHGGGSPDLVPGDTALMAAAFAGQPEVARALIERGANVNHRNSKGQTAMDYAQSPRSRETEEVLRAAGAKASR